MRRTSLNAVSPAGTSTSGGPIGVDLRLGSELVFDVGLNIGQDTAFYLSQGYRVLAIEADISLAEAARKRFAREIQAGQLEILNAGIADRDGFADFWISEGKPEFNSFHREIAARDSFPHHCIQVPVFRFATIIERYGTPYFLKIDIEGNDMLCLEDLSPSSLPTYLSVESECPLDETSACVEDGLNVLRKLDSLGYRKFKLIDQNTFCALTLPPSVHHVLDTVTNKTLDSLGIRKLRGTGIIARYFITRKRLEKRFRREFPQGSSGVWGEETPGRWIGFEEAVSVYRHYREKHFLTANSKFFSFWCDWHAKL